MPLADLDTGPAEAPPWRGVVGDATSIRVEFVDEDGDSIDVSGYTWTAAVLRRPGDSAALATITPDISEAATGAVELPLTDTATTTLGKGLYRWYLRDSASKDTWVVGPLVLANRGGAGAQAQPSNTVTVRYSANTVQVVAVGYTAGGAGATNLSYTASPTGGVVASDTGTDATLTLANGTDAGLMSPAQHGKLAGIEAGATADQSAAEILAALLTVDGAGSGLDADTLDGISSAGFEPAGAVATEAATRAAADTALDGRLDTLEAISFATDAELATAISTHEADTTSVHGIADTSTLYRSGGTDVAVVDGGTGASTAAGARTNLGLGTAATAATGDFEAAGAVAAHTGDTSDAHDASAISFSPVGTIAATDVQAAIAEVASEAAGVEPAIAAPVRSGTRQRIIPTSLCDYGITNSLSANQIRYYPFVLPRGFNLTGLACQVATSVGGSNIRLAVYEADSDWQPTNLVYGTAALSSASTGNKSETFSAVTLTGGAPYLAATVSDNGPSLAMWRGSPSVGVSWHDRNVTIYNVIAWAQVSSTYGAFASTGVAWTSLESASYGSYAPVMLEGTNA